MKKTILKHFKNKTITFGFVGQITHRKNLIVFKKYLDKYLSYWQQNNYKIKVLLAGAKTNSSPEIEQIFSNYLKKNTIKIIYNFTDKNSIYKKIFITKFINPSTELKSRISQF